MLFEAVQKHPTIQSPILSCMLKSLPYVFTVDNKTRDMTEYALDLPE